MVQSKLKLLLLLSLVFVLTGCSFFGSIEWEWKGPQANVNGKVVLRDLGAPFSDARIFFNGPVNRSVTTRRSGRYAIDLPAGTYDVTVRTLHDDYQTQIRVSAGGSEIVDLAFWANSWFDKATFYSLSGIRRWEFAGNHLVYTDDGELARWEQSEVRVYFDTSRAPVPTWRAEQWADDYFEHIRRTWRPLLKDSIAFERVYSSNLADVVVEWVPAGSLVYGEGIRVAVQSFYYRENGALRNVRIKIDEDWATARGLWEHEWARAMGIGYIDDRYSLMYPEMWSSSQRTVFSNKEARHVQLIYDLPSGLSRYNVWSMAAEADEVDGEEIQPLADIELGMGTGYSGHARLVDGSVVPMDSFAAAEGLLGW